jgi:hypothetical protein
LKISYTIHANSKVSRLRADHPAAGYGEVVAVEQNKSPPHAAGRARWKKGVVASQEYIPVAGTK